jgi:hypothetical protein
VIDAPASVQSELHAAFWVDGGGWGRRPSRTTGGVVVRGVAGRALCSDEIYFRKAVGGSSLLGALPYKPASASHFYVQISIRANL